MLTGSGIPGSIPAARERRAPAHLEGRSGSQDDFQDDSQDYLPASPRKSINPKTGYETRSKVNVNGDSGIFLPVLPRLRLQWSSARTDPIGQLPRTGVQWIRGMKRGVRACACARASLRKGAPFRQWIGHPLYLLSKATARVQLTLGVEECEATQALGIFR